MAATILGAAVFVEGRKGTLGPAAGGGLLILAALSVFAAVLHLLARVTE